MKRMIAMLMLVVVILCGCARTPQTTEPTTSPTQSQATQPQTPEEDLGPDLGCYEPDSKIEQDTQGAVRKYALEGERYYALTTMGDGVLLFSGDDQTTLTLLRDGKQPISTTLEGVFLSPEMASCRVTERGIGYYDLAANEIVFLDGELKQIGRTPLPEDMVCEPVLTQDLAYAYYFDADHLRYIDMETGLSRLLTDSRKGTPQIQRMHFGDSVLECHVWDGGSMTCLMIRRETGEVLYRGDRASNLVTDGDWYHAQWRDGSMMQYLFGQRGEEPSCLIGVQEGAMVQVLPQMRSVISWTADTSGFSMTCYDTVEGTRKSAVSMEGLMCWDLAEDAKRGMVWCLAKNIAEGTQAVYGWDPELSLTGDTTSCVAPYHTAETPDTDGLARIAEEAKQLGDRYGLKVLVYEKATDYMPVDYTFEAEHLVGVYERYLPILEKAMSAYPDGFFKKLGYSSGNGRITVCLVRGAYGDGEMGALAQADGVQFWDNGNIYLTLVMNDLFEGTFYHEMYHAIDTYVLTRTLAYDWWDDLNPEGFQYDNDYLTDQDRDDTLYLEDDTRAFIDTYAMSFAKEDRARIVEYAMQEGNGSYFRSPTMQKKLRTICEGIREAFELEREPSAFRWEQYLDEPLGR